MSPFNGVLLEWDMEWNKPLKIGVDDPIFPFCQEYDFSPQELKADPEFGREW